MKTNIREIAPSMFLTRSEMVRALSMYADAVAEGRHDFAQKFADEVIEPVFPRICESLSQWCDALFLAYLIECALDDAIATIKSAGDAAEGRVM